MHLVLHFGRTLDLHLYSPEQRKVWRYGIGRFVFLSFIFLLLGLLCLRSYTLSSMIITALMMVSFPHAIMQKKPPFAAMSLYMGLVGQMSRQYYNLPTLSMHTSDSINPS